MRSAALCVALAPLALSACNSAAPEMRFDPAEAAFIRQEGKATIEGQAFLRDQQGKTNVRYAAGEVVRLIPATAYAQARISQFYGKRKFIPALLMPTPTQEAEYAAYTRTTKAGATGRFTFDKVAPGRYFVTTQLTWLPKGGLISEGGAMYDEIVVTGKETDPIEVVLSGN
ncbi:lipoprotein [Methylosinus sp. PW1]|uniref:lipoprotein n=1 Tax=Methylosinus TaxID=425 RepID=UPI00055B7BD3|nr:lipoprotein [Methylosinus sp. PW1]